jgi:type IV pilus assembly protein PilV
MGHQLSMNPHTTSQRGFTLVEVLVALVIMAIGLLGISGLYVESLRANRTSLLRTHAVNLANDMADRIRANRRGRTDYVKAAGTPPTADSDCLTAACNAQKLAKADLVAWDTAVSKRLPNNAGALPRTSVAFAPAAAGTLDRYTVRIEWFEPSQTDALSYQLVFDVLPPG